MYLLTREMMGSLENYFVQLEQASPYILETNLKINILEVFKAIGVKAAQYADNFLKS